MVEPPAPLPGAPLPDWEAFYRDYRKPGYVPGFEITTKLGGGMFGLVFRARKQSIGKDYAIKFLQVDDGEVRRAVLAELEQVQYFAQIDHPNLVSIEDRGEVDGIPYLVMAFAGTETLRDRMPTDGRAPAGEAKAELLRYFLQCCRGLAALHERSLVHFDVKPANVFLKGTVARLGDYGLSKLVTHSRGSLSMGRGTPYYMAPEMLQRRGDHRSDVYSAGVMLYELLCGKVPFTGDSEWEVLKAHETRQPEWPPHLTAVERAVLQRCLQKDPAARFQSVHDIVAAFGAQTGTGAAAWSDVRAGAGTAAAAAPAGGPPPLPAVPPPPFDAARSPAQRLADEAMRGAQHIADQAVAGARRAFLATNVTIRETMQELRRGGQGAAMAKLRARFRRHHTEPAPAPKRRSGWHTALTVVGAGALSLLVLAFLFLWFLPARVEPSGPVVEYEPMAPVAAVPAPLRQFSLGSDRAQVFTSYMLPDRWRELVSKSEPAWVDLARRDPDAGAAALAQHLERLRAHGPYRARDRIDAELPGIRSGRTIDEPVRAELDELVGRVKAGTDVDEALVDRVITIGPLALAHLAAQFDQLDLGDAEGSRQAHVVHATLAAATGCREIEFVTGSPAAAAAYNRPLGALWTWFVNEVANTERAWRTYRDLRGGR